MSVTPALSRARKPLTEDYAPGTIIEKKYELVARLAEGGMGTVWVARNTTLRAEVALKLIRRELSASREAAQRLLHEARATAQLNHPSIVRIHDFGQTDHGDPFIVMELLRGSTLADLFDRQPRTDATTLVQLMLPIVDALRVAHGQGIVHRDLKPENIFMVKGEGADVTPKLVDFGVAKLRDWIVETDTHPSRTPNDEDPRRSRVRKTLQGLTRNGEVIGSPAYMAPEQARGELSVDGRADIWAVCVVLYEGLSGRRPFEDDEIDKLLLKILDDPPVPLSAHGVDQPALWKILKRGLSKNPDRRFPTAISLGRELARWLIEQGVDTDATGTSVQRKWLGSASLPAVMDLEPQSRVRPTRTMHWTRIATPIAALVALAAASVAVVRAMSRPSDETVEGPKAPAADGASPAGATHEAPVSLGTPATAADAGPVMVEPSPNEPDVPEEKTPQTGSTSTDEPTALAPGTAPAKPATDGKAKPPPKAPTKAAPVPSPGGMPIPDVSDY